MLANTVEKREQIKRSIQDVLENGADLKAFFELFEIHSVEETYRAVFARKLFLLWIAVDRANSSTNKELAAQVLEIVSVITNPVADAWRTIRLGQLAVSDTELLTISRLGI